MSEGNVMIVGEMCLIIETRLKGGKCDRFFVIIGNYDQWVGKCN